MQEEFRFEVLGRLHQVPDLSQRALVKELDICFGGIKNCFQVLEKGLDQGVEEKLESAQAQVEVCLFAHASGHF